MRKMHAFKKIRKQKRKMHKNDKIELALSYIKNLLKLTLSDLEIQVLSKNLKFVPTPAPLKTREFIKDFDDLARRMRNRLWTFENKIKPKTEPLTEKRHKHSDTPSRNIL